MFVNTSSKSGMITGRVTATPKRETVWKFNGQVGILRVNS